jgi:hypothetical protein
MKSFKQLRLEREQLARSEALNRYIRAERGKHTHLRAELTASYFSFALTLLVLAAAT